MSDELFGDFLAAISHCFMQKDFSVWKERVIYPFSLITQTGQVTLSNEDELSDNFKLYLHAVDAMKLDEIIRTPVSLEDCRDGTWIGTYETNMLSHGVRACAPYTSSVLLEKHTSSFKMLTIMNARAHTDRTSNRNEINRQNTAYNRLKQSPS